MNPDHHHVIFVVTDGHTDLPIHHKAKAPEHALFFNGA